MLNKLIIKTLPLVPKSIVHVFAKKYIAGDELSDAVRVTKDLEAEGGMSTIDVLGEFVDTREGALHECSMCSKVIDAIHDNNLQSYLSIKPTSLGLGIDKEFAYDNISTLVKKASDFGLSVRLDMENSPFTTLTLDTYRRLRNDGFDNVGFVIQSYMRRSMDDLLDMKDYKPSVRLCKGIYVEDKSIAFKEPDEIRDNYKLLLDYMLDHGFYVGIATHDEVLINYGRQAVKSRNMKREEYEFQMLLGVREERRKQLVAEGHRLRVYVPFGRDWYGYSTRRLKENPNMAGQIFKSIFFKN